MCDFLKVCGLFKLVMEVFLKFFDFFEWIENVVEVYGRSKGF